MTTAEDTRPKRSVSQRNQYDRCPQAYYLSRIEKVWQKPAAWLPMGSAIHEGIELYEKSGRTMTRDEVADAARDSYAREVSKYTDETPNLNYWQASGPYRGPDDLVRRFDMLPVHVDRYIDWADNHDNEKVWAAPCDDPGCTDPVVGSELGFDVEFGDVPVRGFIDLVIEQSLSSGKALVVRDIKTGNTPGDDFQLGVYARAIEQVYKLPEGSIDAGDYMMTKTGKATFPYDVSKWTNERVAEEFAILEEGIANEQFDPRPDPDKCRFCDVASSCDFRAA